MNLAQRTTSSLPLSIVLAACFFAPAPLPAHDQPDFIMIDCFRREPTINDININRAICDAEATSPSDRRRARYKHGIYRPVTDHDYDNYRKVKDEAQKCPPKSPMYICLGVGVGKGRRR